MLTESTIKALPRYDLTDNYVIEQIPYGEYLRLSDVLDALEESVPPEMYTWMEPAD